MSPNVASSPKLNKRPSAQQEKEFNDDDSSDPFCSFDKKITSN
jgi:hypothetical protein